jgi:pimeloyl-ACP methyl ester carboxylesterase
MKNLILLLFSLYLLILGYLYFAQRSFIYFPSVTRPVAAPPNYELKNDGLLLKGWVLNEGEKDAILYFGGNGESIEYNLPQFRKIFSHHAVYMLSYRGYGSSEGVPSELGIYSDAQALYDKIRAKHRSVSVVGRSLGSGVATYIASSREINGVVLITPFASLVDMAKRQFPIFPVSILLKDKYLSEERVRSIKSKSLILYAENDEVVPVSSTEKLIANFDSELLEVVEVKGVGHNSISTSATYEIKLEQFIENLKSESINRLTDD